MTQDDIETQRHYADALDRDVAKAREQIKSISAGPDAEYAKYFGALLLSRIDETTTAVRWLASELSKLKVLAEVRELAWREVMREMAHKTIAEAMK